MSTASHTSPGKPKTTSKRGQDAMAASRATPMRRSSVVAPTIPAKAFTAAMKRIDATIRETDEIMKEAMALVG